MQRRALSGGPCGVGRELRSAALAFGGPSTKNAVEVLNVHVFGDVQAVSTLARVRVNVTAVIRHKAQHTMLRTPRLCYGLCQSNE